MTPPLSVTMRAGASHRGHPVRGGHRRDEDLAGDEMGCLLDRLHDADGPGDDAGGRRTSAHDGPELDSTPSPLVGVEPGRDRPGLDEEDLVAVDGPLHVLGCAVVTLGARREVDEREHLGVREHPPVGLVVRERLPSLDAVRVASDRDRLVADPRREHGRRVLARDVGVRLHLPADHDFAEPERGVDHDVVRVAGRGVGAEHDSGPVGVDHLLHDDRDGGLRGQCSRDERYSTTRSPKADVQQAMIAVISVVVTLDVREALVHARERGVLGVLCRRRRAHRHAALRAQLVVRREHDLPQVVRHSGARRTSSRRVGGPRPDLGGIVGALDDRAQLGADAGAIHRVEVGVREEHEARGTGSPAAVSSPRFAPLPPARATSCTESSSNQAIERAVGLGVGHVDPADPDRDAEVHHVFESEDPDRVARGPGPRRSAPGPAAPARAGRRRAGRRRRRTTAGGVGASATACIASRT